MAIRLNHEAAAAFVPPSASNRKYGQQLVLQQQKFANDQRQGMQDRMYDQQREYRRTAYQLQKDQTDRFVDNQRMQEQQKFAERMQKNSLDAQQQRDLQEAQRRSEMMAKQQEEQRVAQLKAQERADVEDAIKSGAIDQITASEIKKSWALDTRIDLNPEYDEAQRAEAHRENQWNRSKLQENRSQVPSLADMGNKNLQYYVPSMRGYVNREEAAKLGPDVEVQVYQDGKLMPGPSARGPMSAQDYYRADGAMFKKDLASKMSELQGKVDAGEMTLEKGQDLRSLAWQQMQDDYNFAQQALGGSQPVQGGQAAQPPMQGGQPAMPPAPAAQPPAMGMQDLEPTYNADGTTSVPGQPVGDPMMRPPMVADPSAEAALPATQGQPAAAPMRVQHQDGRIFEQSPDGNWREVQPVASQPIQQADGTTLAPGQQAAAPVALGQQDKLQRDLDALRSLEAGQPTDALPIEQAGMQSPPQNAWTEVVAPEQQAAQSEASPADAVFVPDFTKLSEGAKDDEDRFVLGKLQGIYDKQSPDVQAAIGAVVDPGADPKLAAQAYLYLKSKGIDISQLAKPKKRQLPGMSGIR